MSGIAHDFYPLVQSIARQRKVIIFDHRGIGQSAFPDTEEWEGDLTIDDMAFDVIDILKHLKVQEADLLGWSESISFIYRRRCKQLKGTSTFLQAWAE